MRARYGGHRVDGPPTPDSRSFTDSDVTEPSWLDR